MNTLLVFLIGLNIITRQIDTKWQLVVGTALLVIGLIYGALHGFPIR